MAQVIRQVDVSECDACGKRSYTELDDTPAAGFYGTVREVTPDYGGADIAWHACRESHIGQAVKKAMTAYKDQVML